MSDDLSSLANLQDIIVPEPPPFWPLAPGAWWVIGILFLLLILICIYWYRRWRANAYRRAGLELLKEAHTVHDILVILKRVALAAFPREQVASLYGAEWNSFLSQTCLKTDFSALAAEAASKSDYLSNLKNLARIWILNHTTDIRQA